MKTKDVKLFDNLSLLECDEGSFDLHNDFNCLSLSLKENCMFLNFERISNKMFLTLKFTKVKLVQVHFNFHTENNSLTVDNLYRGRFESNGSLSEFSNLGQSYFYLEFYEGQSIDFFCDELLIDTSS